MNRRLFIKSGLATLGTCASSHAMANGLGLLSNISNQDSSISDYKTLVCVNLQGGADSISLIVPTFNSEFLSYQKIRQNLTYEKNSLRDFSAKNVNTSGLGMPSFMSEFLDLFDNGKLSIISNVGPLSENVSLKKLNNNPSLLPPFLGSHNDQENLWQSAGIITSEKSGWGGRLIESLHLNSSSIPSNISLVGTRKFLRGKDLFPFSVDPDMINNLGFYLNYDGTSDNPMREKLNNLIALGKNEFDSTYSQRLISTIEKNKQLKFHVDSLPVSNTDYNINVDNDLVGNEALKLSNQFKRAAQLIELAPAMGQNRQIIYVQLSTFDTHDNQKDLFSASMKALGICLKNFQEDLEARGVDDRVVTFTTSEFGRTITINSNGTDHGWGGHQFVMGTPVNGGQVIGELPEYEIGSSDIYQNMFIPQYSVEQYGANLAKWFGLSASEFTYVFPNYGRFDAVNFNLFN